ncbi:hypothetical protein MAP00_003063 [Monascus purpureus]|nr:hypothetical protein MAP00_003063 [Monascus purpureus]
MALVQYSDSDSDTSDYQPSPPRPIKKNRREGSTSPLPPLPTAFHDLYASSTRVSIRDDPSLHGGRKRVIPHIEGNWPTHIYLEWHPSRTELDILQSVVSRCGDGESGEHRERIHSLLYSDLGAQLPLHISLSRPVVLQTEQRSSFTEAFQTALRDSHIRPFNVEPDGLNWVSNYEKTRWFLVVRVKRPDGDNLNALLRLSNRSLTLFRQPPLYETGTVQKQQSRLNGSDPGDFSHCFHISIAWSLNKPSLEMEKRTAGIDLKGLRDLTVHFNSVKVKIGNNISSMPLSQGTFEEKGFGGL